ncbi:hypothetical protein QFZ67_005108 [Streptomyces sp. V1I1]|nr:hypothetical protein [Streptomyces sp. V1I1]
MGHQAQSSSACPLTQTCSLPVLAAATNASKPPAENTTAGPVTFLLSRTGNDGVAAGDFKAHSLPASGCSRT